MGFHIPLTIPYSASLFRAFFILSTRVYGIILVDWIANTVVHRLAAHCDQVVHARTTVFEREKGGGRDGGREGEREGGREEGKERYLLSHVSFRTSD